MDEGKASFIKMPTWSSADNIYKMVQNPLSSSSDNHRLDEIESVRLIFKV